MIRDLVRDEFDLDVRLRPAPASTILAERELPSQNTCADTCADTCRDTCRDTCACVQTGDCPVTHPVASRYCP
jgi:hypothetical protein